MQSILITGGAGYIGSHMSNMLLQSGFNVVVIDDLSAGFIENIKKNVVFVKGDIANEGLVRSVVSKYNIHTVMHFAASVSVEESMNDPAKYYLNNVEKSLRLLDSVIKEKVKYFIFSSTAAIFGEPLYHPINELHPTSPVNVYGKTKLVFEEILRDYHQAYGLQFGCLRYFNACGSDYSNMLGDRKFPASHLIARALQRASGRLKDFVVYGNDYATCDGTAIRDYIHVLDLCAAHLRLLQYLQNGGQERYFNLGTGQGHTVLEVVNMAIKVTGKVMPIKYSGRRKGDAAILTADASKARGLLQWEPSNSSLYEMMHSAWKWEELQVASCSN